MTRILFSLLLVLSVIGMVAGSTRAVFSESLTNTGNSFTVEDKFSILLDGHSNSGIDVGTGPLFTVTDLIPGGDIYSNLSKVAYLEVKNDGDMDLLFRAYAANVHDSSDDEELSKNIKVRVTLNPEGYTPNVTGYRYGPSEETSLGVFSLQQLRNQNLLNNLNAAFDNGWPLKPNYYAVYKLEVYLPLNVGNSVQGKSVTADLKIDAVQFDGQTEGSVDWL